MDTLNFLKFWKQNTMATTSNTIPHLLVETDSETDEEDSFFDLELTINDFDNQQNDTTSNKKDAVLNEGFRGSRNALSKMLKSECECHREIDVPKKLALSMSPNEPISKRKVLPIEPFSKPQSPISLLKSAPSFRIFMFKKKHKRMEPQKTEEVFKKKETKVSKVKLSVDEFHCSPILVRGNSTRNHGSKVRNQGSEGTKTERFSKENLQKYLKLIKPLYVKVSKRYSEKMRLSSEASSSSPMSSPSLASVSSRKEKQGSFPVGIRVGSKNLGKIRSSSTVIGVGSPANRSDDTLLQQHDGIQSAILHCKRSFNSGDSSATLSSEGSVHSLRNSFEDENVANM